MIREDLLDRPAPALRVEVVQDAIGLHALRVEWQQLWERGAENPFLTWDWLQAAWTRVTPQRRPLVLVARTGGGELVGVLPLSIERQAGLARVARFLGDLTVGSDYLDALVAPELAEPVRRALWSETLRLAGDAFDVLELHELLQGSDTERLVRDFAATRALELEALPGYRCPHIAVRQSFAEYLKGVSRADNLKRKRKQLEKLPGFAIDVASEPEQVLPALETFFELHRKRWAGDGGSQGITGERVEHFHREVVRRFARKGQVRLYTLRVEGRAIASVYMLGRGSTRYFYQSGYDPAFAKQSPGLVLLARTIEDAFAEGAREYDFLHGSEPYKFEWANGERATLSLRASVPTLRGKWLAAERAAVASARAWGQRLLGEGGYDVLRRLRRRWAPV